MRHFGLSGCLTNYGGGASLTQRAQRSIKRIWSRSKFSRAELKVTHLKVTEPNLRLPAVYCENLRFPAKICGFLRFPAPSKCWNFQEKGWICENLWFSAKICVLGSLCHLSSVTLSSPWFSISIEIFDLARKFWSRCLDLPHKNRAAVGGSLENFILDRNFQSRSKSQISLIFGPSGKLISEFSALRVNYAEINCSPKKGAEAALTQHNSTGMPKGPRGTKILRDSKLSEELQSHFSRT